MGPGTSGSTTRIWVFPSRERLEDGPALFLEALGPVYGSHYLRFPDPLSGVRVRLSARNSVETWRAYFLDAMDVALIQWPSDQALRMEMAERHHPRLLLVDSDAEPPEITDELEDWVRLPVSRADRNARIRALESRARGQESPAPRLNGDGSLHYRGATTQLSAIQIELIRPMIERFGAVVAREALAALAWPDTDPSDNNLDVTIGRLRRQLVPAGLRIRTVRSRGYLLCDADPGVR